MQIVFQLVTVEPSLPDVDSRIGQDRGLVGSEPVSHLRAMDTCHGGPDDWKEAREDASEEGILLPSPSRKEPGSLDVVKPFFQYRGG